jgi:hypothetical protein
MERVIGTVLVFCLLAAILLSLPACQKQEVLEGQLPTFQVGDKWVWSYVMGETTYTLTEELIGEQTVEGKDCYVIDMSFDPTISWSVGDVVSTTTNMKYWADKATYFCGVKMESSGTQDGTDFTRTETYSYNPWASLFPLEIGKEIEWEKTTIQYSDGTQVGDPVATVEKYSTGGKEDVTVMAGTYSCWKITMYDGGGNVVGTIWYSDKVKSPVKQTDADGNVLMELQSYSVG